MQRKNWIKKFGGAAVWQALLLGIIGILSTGTAKAASYVPAVVVSSQATVATGLPNNATSAAIDACGNIYAAVPGTGVMEIPAGGGAATTVFSGNTNVDYVSMNSAKTTLYLAGGTNSTYQTASIPITSCVLQTASATTISVGNQGAISWWYTAVAIAADSNGNSFITTTGACCTSSYQLIEENSNSTTGSTLLTGLAAQIDSLAVDSSENIYYVSGGQLYELPATITTTTNGTTVTYATNAVSFGSTYSDATGVSIGTAGNLYITDKGASTVYEIPLEYNSSTLTSALNPADQFVVLSNTNATSALAPGASGAFAFTSASTTIYSLSIGSVNLGNIAVGSSDTLTLTALFDSAETPQSFSLATANKAFQTVTGGTCAASTSYSAGDSCTINVKYTASVPGASASGLAITDSNGNLLTNTYLSATAMGASLTVDPGTLSTLGSGYKKPMGVAVDAAGDFFVADASANSVDEIAAGSSTVVQLGSNLSGPQGVAVDSLGDLFIADTGNNQIVEIPVVNGALNTANQVVVIGASDEIATMALSAPAGVTVDLSGNLYITDTGNNRIVYLPNAGGYSVASATVLASSLTQPLATTIDSNGNLYIANSGSGQIIELPAPLSQGVQELVAVGFGNPSALAVDASGSLFIADPVNGEILRVPSVSGSLNPDAAVEVGIGIAAPYGVATDPSGNLYASDATAAATYKVDRTTTSTLDFGSWAVNATAGPLAVELENEGNQSLTFASPFYTASGDTADFSVDSSASDACIAGTVAAGSTCTLAATFTPTATGSFADTLTLSSNAAVSPQIALSGSGVTPAATTTTLAITSPASGTPFFGEPITLTATVAATSGTPSGVVDLLVDGVEQGASSLNASGVATFSIPTGLTGGTHSLSAVYEGAASFNGSNSTALNITVSQAPTTVELTASAPYMSPNSAVQGAKVSFAATITSTGVGIPTGTVTFNYSATSASGAVTTGTLGSAPVLPAAGGSFEASYSTTSLPVGTDAVTATYSGDANYISSTSAAVTVYVVSSANVVTTASGSTVAVTDGSSGTVTFTATSYGGWTGVVGFTCDPSTLPANTTCVFAPGQLAITPSTAGAIQAPSTMALSFAVNQPPQTPTASKMLWWVAIPTGMLLLMMRRRLKLAAASSWMGILLLIAAVGAISAGVLGTSACNAGGYKVWQGTTPVTVYAWSDPYTSGSTNTTQACGVNAAGNPDTSVAPCSKQAFTVNVTVQ